MQQSADKGQNSWFRPSSAVMYGAEVWTTKAVKDKMSAVVSPQHSSHPETALLTFCTALGYYPVYIDAAKLCWQHRSEHGGWPMAQGGCDSHSRAVARPKGGTDWCGNVKSITEQIQHT
jgi:hypothetical protein